MLRYGADYLCEYDAAGNLTRDIHSLGIDEPLAVTKGLNTFYYHQDGLGNVTSLTDSLGFAVQQYDYDAFGNQLSVLDPAFIQPYGFTGRELDPFLSALFRLKEGAHCNACYSNGEMVCNSPCCEACLSPKQSCLPMPCGLPRRWKSISLLAIILRMKSIDRFGSASINRMACKQRFVCGTDTVGRQSLQGRVTGRSIVTSSDAARHMALPCDEGSEALPLPIFF